MQRIVITGPPGVGKTTLAQILASHLQYPMIELDDLYWNPGWQPNEPSVFREKTAQAIANDCWVITGHYSGVREALLNRADTLIWLDYSFWRTFQQLAWRTFLRLWDKRLVCNGNRESLKLLFSKNSIILYLVTDFERRRRQNRQTFAVPGNHPAIKNFIHLKSPKETKQFIGTLQT